MATTKLTPEQIKENDKKLPEALAISIVTKMATKSLSPEMFEQWKKIANQLVKNRNLQKVYTPKNKAK